MKVRFVLENKDGYNHGYTHGTSVEYDLDVIPRIGEEVFMEVTELVKRALSVKGNVILYMNEAEQEEGVITSLTVAKIEHYLVWDKGVYIILVDEYSQYKRDQ